MARVALRTGRVSVSADLPPAVTRRLHRLRNRLRGTPAGGATGPGALVVSRRTPTLRIEHRDARRAAEVYPGAGAGASGEPGGGDLAARVEDLFWYHSIELPGGIVTPGVYDHRPLVPHYGLPDRLDGQRVLDVATFDGFWAFELERRGADVVAADIDRFSACDLPPPVRQAMVAGQLDRDTGLGFRLAHEALGSSVQKVVRSVYDLDPDDLGTFDMVHVADLLLHLERPLEALRAIRSVTRGRALVADCFDPGLEPGVVRYLGAWASVPWWLPSLDTLAQMVLDAGFSDVALQKVYTLAPRGEERGHWRASLLATA